MINKLSGPTFEPIYELDQRIDIIEGYDHLRFAVHALAAHYPEDEYHTALEQATQVSLAVCRRKEVSETIALRGQLRDSNIGTKMNKESGMSEAIAERTTKRLAVGKIQKAAQKHLVAFFEETGLTSHDVMQDIAGMEIDKAKRELEEARQALEQRQASVKQARAILKRPFDRITTPLENAGHAERETMTDPAALGFNRVAAILQQSKSGIVHEPGLVRTLYPDLYATDRPAAYQQFDEIFDQFANLSKRFSSTHGFMQEGTMYTADESGQAASSRLGGVYRRVDNDQAAIINSKGGMQQRVTLSGAPHVVVWEEVTPQHIVRRRQS